MEKNPIDLLGGPTKVVELLGWREIPGSVQRVSNWKKRGIPSRVLLDYPHVFPPPEQPFRGSELAQSEAA